ncbi:MAG TPA: trypsin-like peptidase domain-containing protein [Candidatus Hydrogenedentes bacterium]|nr:trypsin-like peptidase domain-containing protein [Candidatus Hydrogenedentota bacterium]
MLVKVVLPMFIVLGVCASGGWAVSEKPTITLISGTHWKPAPPAKVIYGTDDRIDVYQETDSDRLTWAASSCALINSSRVTNNGDGTYTILPAEFQQYGLPACPEEPFGDQPTAAFCSGGMVGTDLVVTAGHCYDEGDLSSVYFIFGYVMENATTPVLTFPSDCVYQGVEVVGHQLTGTLDYSVIRVDRPITAPGAHPFTIRRESVIAVGEHVGVIGHPSGLPMKIAFGNDTVVRANDNEGFFVANLDTYHGNSGSPVINPVTGILEGVLVRGDIDYVSHGDCFVSNVVPNDGGRGEDVSKSTSFMDFVPVLITSTGTIKLNRAYFSCSDTLEVELRDADVQGAGQASVQGSTSSGDSESIVLTEGIPAGIFRGTIGLQAGPVTLGNGQLEGVENDTVLVSYADADDGTGQPATATAMAVVDCTAPIIQSIAIESVGSSQATVAFTTNEPTTAILHAGLGCGIYSLHAEGLLSTDHLLHLNGLQNTTPYFFIVDATDEAGNPATDDNGGLCYSFTTVRQTPYFTELFDETGNPFDLANRSLTFIPINHTDGYSACIETAQAFPSDPSGGNAVVLDDDSFATVSLSGMEVKLYGVSYDQFFIGSNGYITFLFGDQTYTSILINHFAIQRISALFHDFSPNIRGQVSWKQFDDRIAVTYDSIPEYNGSGVYPPENSNSFQIELFANGLIRITYLGMYAKEGIAGLSAGNDTPTDFTADTLNLKPSCAELDTDCDGLPDYDEFVVYGSDPVQTDTDGDTLPDGWEALRGLNPASSEGDDGAGADPDMDGLTNAQEFAEGTLPLCTDSDRDGVSDGQEITDGTDPTGADQPHTADTDGDWVISLSEMLRIIQLYNSNGFHCSPGTEDGYAVDTGSTGCLPHNSDYIEQDWHISLSELLRIIQFFTIRAYHRDLLGEDTFAPGKQ